MIQVAVSILNHNSADISIACIQSLLIAVMAASSTCELEIYISDNASEAEDQRLLQQSLQEIATVHLVLNDENLGFSAGHNRNLQSIFSHSNPDYIWLLNNDCLVEERALLELLKCAQRNPEMGIWGATLLEPDGETIQCAGGCFYNTWVSSYRQHGRGRFVAQLDQLKPAEFDYIAGAAMFFPATTLKNGLRALPESLTNRNKVGQQWLNENFFLYFEELDLAKRLEPGLGMAWCKDALIIHAGGASTGTSENKRTTLAEYYSTLSALKFTRQYYPRRLWVMAPARYFAKCLLSFVRGDFSLIGAMTRAYWFFFASELVDIAGHSSSKSNDNR
jgi:GT2 family glycosyltransferase